MAESKSLVKISNTYKVSVYITRLGFLCSLISLILMATVFGAHFEMAFFTGLGLYLVFLGLVLRPYENEKHSKLMGYLKIALFSVTLIWLISFIIIEGFIISAFKQDTPDNTKYVVILGGGLKGDTPTQSTVCRLITGVGYLKKHPEKLAVVSGGQLPDETTTEARVMANYLVNHGIARGRIIQDERSKNTYENLVNSKKIIDRREGTGGHKILIITSDNHLFRAKMLARRVGFAPYGLPAKLPFWLQVKDAVREYFAVVKSYFVDK